MIKIEAEEINRGRKNYIKRQNRTNQTGKNMTETAERLTEAERKTEN